MASFRLQDGKQVHRVTVCRHQSREGRQANFLLKTVDEARAPPGPGGPPVAMPPVCKAEICHEMGTSRPHFSQITHGEQPTCTCLEVARSLSGS